VVVRGLSVRPQPGPASATARSAHISDPPSVFASQFPRSRHYHHRRPGQRCLRTGAAHIVLRRQGIGLWRGRSAAGRPTGAFCGVAGLPTDRRPIHCDGGGGPHHHGAGRASAAAPSRGDRDWPVRAGAGSGLPRSPPWACHR
jgi:hypothetical protein